MTSSTASTGNRARAWRWGGVCAVSVLLHWLLLEWLGAQVAGLSMPKPVIKITLAPPRAGAGPALGRSDQTRLRPLAAAPAPVPSPPLPGAPAAAAAAPPAPAVAAGGPAVQDAAPGADMRAAQDEVLEDVEHVKSRYEVAAIAPAELAYAVTLEQAGVVTGRGDALLSWQRRGLRYEMLLENRFDGALAARHPRERRSMGGMDDAGVAPDSATETSSAGATVELVFDHASGRLLFSHSSAEFPIPSGMQDAGTVAMQLAGIGKAKPRQFQNRVSMYVAAPGGISVFSVDLVGEETLDTALGKVLAWHFVQAVKPGAERLELWLAPQFDYLALKLRSTAPDGAVTTHLVSRLARPPLE